MDNTNALRPAERADIESIRALVVANDMFPGEILDEMIEPFFLGYGEDLWFVVGDEPSGVAFAALEKLTNGTWNQLMIAVDPARHGTGIGKSLMRHLEAVLAVRGARMVIVDTSGIEAFDGTRNFYRTIGYEEVARIPDFWDAGDDKITFRRLLV